MAQSLLGFICVCPAGDAQKICLKFLEIIFLPEAEIIKCVFISSVFGAVLADSSTTYFTIEPGFYERVHASLGFAPVRMFLKPTFNAVQFFQQICIRVRIATLKKLFFRGPPFPTGDEYNRRQNSS